MFTVPHLVTADADQKHTVSVPMARSLVPDVAAFDTEILLLAPKSRHRTRIRRMLETCGWRVSETVSRRHALARIAEARPDVAIVDTDLPGGDALDTSFLLRSLAGGGVMPIVMLPRHADGEQIERALAAGAASFVTKPVEAATLAQRVGWILGAKRTAEELRESQRRLARAQRLANLGHWDWTRGAKHVTCSPGLLEMLGVAGHAGRVSIAAFLRAVHKDDRPLLHTAIRHSLRFGVGGSVNYRVNHRDGTTRFIYQEYEAVTAADGTVQRLAGIAQDVSERCLAERRIRNLAYYDATTGLPNRTLLSEMVRNAVEHARRSGSAIGLLCLDIDHFRRINDNLGHTAGDLLLQDMAARLSGCVRHGDRVYYGGDEGGPSPGDALDSDVLARLGGDEFAIILSDMRNVGDGARTARRIEQAVSRPFVISGTELSVTVSIGISIYPTDGNDPETLLKHADAAMNYAKERGRACHQVFSDSLSARVKKRFSLETSLRKAIDNGELLLFYQPKVDIRDNRVVGMESLIRWKSPDLGLVPPSEFISVAEETGLIVPIGDWVLHEACRQTKAWHEEGLEPFSISVNLSAAQFRKPGLVSRVAAIVTETGLDPRHLDLELTEGLLMDSTDANILTLRDLAALGVSISIDDFGTGYSSLCYLKRFPISFLKIDQSFVRDVTTSPDDAAIVSATIALAHSLRMRAIAEGVEHRQQLEFLRGQGCDQAQGFLYSRPSAADEVGQWVRSRQAVTGFPTRIAG